jgi:uncharacterized protein YwgA
MIIFDAILATIRAAGGSITGRTAIQKLMYFENVSKVVDIKYRPHYYGPYSAQVAGAIQELIDLDFLKEEMDTAKTTGFPVPDDWKRYRYTLTSDGKKVVELLDQENEEEINKISNLVRTCQETVNLDANMLSYSAKVYYIISSQSKAMTVNEIQKTAGSFGWNLSQNDINDAVDLLKQLYSVK